MKKHKICKILLVILAILLCVAFYELLGICIAYKKQPEVLSAKRAVMEKQQTLLICFQKNINLFSARNINR